MTWKRVTPDRPDRSAEFASFVAQPRAAVMAARLHAVPVAHVPPKVQGRVDNAIRNSARGEECQVRIIGVCRGGTEHTIWSHAPLGAAGKGRSIKAVDAAGAYCCTACDSALDQAQRPAGMTREQVLLDWFHGHMRSLVLLARKGLL